MPVKPHHLIPFLLLFLLTPLPATSKGIGCWGSKRYCNSFEPRADRYLLLQSLAETPDNATFVNGRNIACLPGIGGNLIDGAICVWVWDTDNTTTGATVKEIAAKVPEHGCKLCGSAPIVQDGSNDLSKGQVTFGWSFNEGQCDGQCNEYGASDYLPGAVVPGTGGPPRSHN